MEQGEVPQAGWGGAINGAEQGRDVLPRPRPRQPLEPVRPRLIELVVQGLTQQAFGEQVPQERTERTNDLLLAEAVVGRGRLTEKRSRPREGHPRDGVPPPPGLRELKEPADPLAMPGDGDARQPADVGQVGTERLEQAIGVGRWVDGFGGQQVPLAEEQAEHARRARDLDVSGAEMIVCGLDIAGRETAQGRSATILEPATDSRGADGQIADGVLAVPAAPKPGQPVIQEWPEDGQRTVPRPGLGPDRAHGCTGGHDDEVPANLARRSIM